MAYTWGGGGGVHMNTHEGLFSRGSLQADEFKCRARQLCMKEFLEQSGRAIMKRRLSVRRASYQTKPLHHL